MKFISPKQILNEIKAREAYAKFYQPKGLPEEVFNLVMTGQDNMTKFHKKVLDGMLDPNNYNGEFDIFTVARWIANKWPLFSSEQKIFAIEEAEDIANPILSPNEIMRILATTIETKVFNQKTLENNGLIILYNENGIRVTCTTTYAASTHHYGKTHWCTASDMCGDYPGWLMYKNYVTDSDVDSIYSDIIHSVLIQAINSNTSETYQAQIDGMGRTVIMCDFMDEKVDSTLSMVFGKWGIDYQTIVVDNLEKCFRATEGNFKNEDVFMTRFIRRKKAVIGQQLVKEVKSGVWKERITPDFIESLYDYDTIERGVRLRDKKYFGLELYQNYTEKGVFVLRVLPQSKQSAFFYLNTTGDCPKVLIFVDENTKEIKKWFELPPNKRIRVARNNLLAIGGFTVIPNSENDFIYNIQTGEKIELEHKLMGCQIRCGYALINYTIDDGKHMLTSIYDTVTCECLEDKALFAAREGNSLVYCVLENGIGVEKTLPSKEQVQETKTRFRNLLF